MEDFPPPGADDKIGGAAANTRHRFIVTICLMIATLMQALDTTVANVSLPYMQGSLSASYNQITWVLTSYVVASAIFTAPVGWLTARFGAKNLMLTCMIGFTLTSIMCGLAPNMTDVVIARFLQGMFGAAVVPLSQSTLIDIYPPERRGVTMSLWGLGVMLGPVLGPTLGGFLTSHYNWRYVFFVNIPFGIAGTLGLLFYMPRVEPSRFMRFDWIGFFILSLCLATLQLALDRGDQLDWLSSPLIVIAFLAAALCLYLFIVHMMTAKDPFIPRSIFTDMNFDGALLTMFTVGACLLASLSLLPPYLENLANYPVEYTGIVMAPRGIGTVCAMLLAGRLTNRFDCRKLMLLGYAMLTGSLYMQQSWTPDISVLYIGATIALQGAAIGFVFVPLQVIAYQTLAPALYTQGAALLALLRSVGSAIGVSVTTYMLDRQTQVEHAELSQYVTPFARPLQAGGEVSRMLDPHTLGGASMLNSIIGTQSQIIAYVDDYKLMLLTTLPAILCLFFMRRPPHAVGQS
jgi:DHA2 family multidrug resistance protein